MPRKPSESKAKALQVVKIAMDKKAIKPVVLDVRKLFVLYDYFVVCSAETERNARAIYDEIRKKFGKGNNEVHHCEDDSASRWLLIDMFDVVMHIFTEDARGFYNLEYLWRDAKKVSLASLKKK